MYRTNASEESDKDARADAEEIEAVARAGRIQRARVAATLATLVLATLAGISAVALGRHSPRLHCHRVVLNWETNGAPFRPADSFTSCDWQ